MHPPNKFCRSIKLKMHSHLDFSQGIVHEPKLAQQGHVESLAREALKHIPGGAAIVEKHFSNQQQFRDLLPKKAENQLMYPPHP